MEGVSNPPLLWHLLTSHGKLYSMTFVKVTNNHVRETSLVKHIVFPSYTHLIYYMQFRVVIGLQLFLQPYPCKLALYQVSVRWVRCLPLTSFRFRVTSDTLVSLAGRFPLLGLVRDLHPLDNTHASQTKKRGFYLK